MQQRKFRIAEIKLLTRQSLEGKWKRFIPLFSVYVLLLLSIPFIVSYYFDPLVYPDRLIAIAANTGSSLYSLLVAGPFAVGAAALVLNLIRRKPFSITNVFEGFKCWGTSFISFVLVTVYSILWVIIFLLPGSILFAASVFNGFDINYLNYAPDIQSIMSMDSLPLYLMAAAISLTFVLGIVSLIFIMRYQMTYFAIADRSGKLKARDAIKESRRIMKGKVLKLFGLNLSFIAWHILLLLEMAAAVILYNIYLLSSLSDNARTISLVICVAVSVIFIISWIAIQVYIQTSYAVSILSIAAMSNYHILLKIISNRTFLPSPMKLKQMK